MKEIIQLKPYHLTTVGQKSKIDDFLKNLT